jgi:hypothetical protein
VPEPSIFKPCYTSLRRILQVLYIAHMPLARNVMRPIHEAARCWGGSGALHSVHTCAALPLPVDLRLELKEKRCRHCHPIPNNDKAP